MMRSHSPQNVFSSRSAHLGLDLFVAVVDDLGKTEVSQLDDFLAVHEEHVVGLDVSVQHLLLLVQVVHAQAQLPLLAISPITTTKSKVAAKRKMRIGIRKNRDAGRREIRHGRRDSRDREQSLTPYVAFNQPATVKPASC